VPFVKAQIFPTNKRIEISDLSLQQLTLNGASVAFTPS
jgi:hypothetical protein